MDTPSSPLPAPDVPPPTDESGTPVDAKMQSETDAPSALDGYSSHPDDVAHAGTLEGVRPIVAARATGLRVRDTSPDTTVKAALLFLCFVTGIAGLYYAGDLLAPFALAVFFWLIIDAFARWMHDLAEWVPYRGALTVAVLIIVAAIGGLIWVTADTATDIAANSELYTRRLAGVAVWVTELTGVDVSRSAMRDAFDLGALVSGGLGGFAAAIQGFIADLFLIAIYTIFLFVAQGTFARKLDDLVPEPDGRKRTADMFLRIRHSIETYLSVQTLISLIQTVLSFIIMVWFGLDNALFWALVIFILNYIPIVGAIGAAFLPALFALVQFDSVGSVLALAALLLVVQGAIANTLQPKMMGDSMNLSALVVVIALVVWGALWGGTGAFLSAPLTVIIMVVLAQFPTTRWMAVILSQDGQPDLDPYQKRRNRAVPAM